MCLPFPSQYTEEIQQHFNRNEIKLSTVTLLTRDIRNQLHSFSDKAHDVDFSSVTQQVQSVCVCVRIRVTFGLVVCIEFEYTSDHMTYRNGFDVCF